MMQINGITLAAFEKWFYENHSKCSKKFEELLTWEKSEIMDYLFNACETIQHAFLIEFFDSVVIYIESLNEFGQFGMSIHNGDYRNPIESIGHWETRQEAISMAIEKANEIFNNRQA